MRLIDADKLIDRFKELKGSDTLANMFVRDVIKEISKQPTAYDVDKVVERIKEKGKDDSCGGIGAIWSEDAVEIIKSSDNIFDNPELLKGDTNGKTDSM